MNNEKPMRFWEYPHIAIGLILIAIAAFLIPYAYLIDFSIKFNVNPVIALSLVFVYGAIYIICLHFIVQLFRKIK